MCRLLAMQMARRIQGSLARRQIALRGATILSLAMPLGSLLACQAVRPTPMRPTHIVIDEVWLRPAGLGGSTAAFMRIHNPTSEADRLLGARTPLARQCRLQQTQLRGGSFEVLELGEGIQVESGAMVELLPGGFQVAILGLRSPLSPGDTVPLTLVFQRAGEVQVEARVRQPLEFDEPGRGETRSAAPSPVRPKGGPGG